MANTNEITFKINGATYTRKANGYCYVTYEYSDNGKVHRIGNAEFEAKYAQFRMEEAVEATGESQTTEEIKQIANEFAPKKKRTRKSKDVAFAVTVDGVETTLTAKQVDFIRHLPDSNFWENGLDSVLWTDVLADEIGGQFEGKPMTTGAMISTLCEKGLGVRSKEKINNRTATAFKLTGLGRVIAAELGLA